MAEQETPKIHTPSKFFTEYYGVAVLFLIAAFIGAAFVFLRPIIVDIKETNARTAETIVEANEAREYLKSLEQSVAAAQSITGTVLENVNHALPNDANIPSLMVQIGNVASAHGMRIANISISDPRVFTKASGTLVTPLYSTMDIALSLTAQSYFDMKRFLTDIESSLRLFDVTSLSTSGGGEKGVSFAITMKTYVFTPPHPLP